MSVHNQYKQNYLTNVFDWDCLNPQILNLCNRWSRKYCLLGLWLQTFKKKHASKWGSTETCKQDATLEEKKKEKKKSHFAAILLVKDLPEHQKWQECHSYTLIQLGSFLLSLYLYVVQTCACVVCCTDMCLNCILCGHMLPCFLSCLLFDMKTLQSKLGKFLCLCFTNEYSQCSFVKLYTDVVVL